MIAATRVGGRRYLKFTLLNAATTVEQMREIVDLVLEYGRANAVGAVPGSAAVNAQWRRHG